MGLEEQICVWRVIEPVLQNIPVISHDPFSIAWDATLRLFGIRWSHEVELDLFQEVFKALLGEIWKSEEG